MTKRPSSFSLGSLSPTLAKESCTEPDFTSNDEMSDITLIVEGKKLFTNRAFLIGMSPVFERMFCSDFKEKDLSELPLPGKKFDDVHELLKVVHPRILKDLTGEICLKIFPLAEEYQMYRLKKRCEALLSETLKGEKVGTDICLQILNLSEKYGLLNLWKSALKSCSRQIYFHMQYSEHFKNLSEKTAIVLEVFMKK
ncbi:hypothetical protein ScPMuIL_013780 [Solemya velum]